MNNKDKEIIKSLIWEKVGRSEQRYNDIVSVFQNAEGADKAALSRKLSELSKEIDQLKTIKLDEEPAGLSKEIQEAIKKSFVEYYTKSATTTPSINYNISIDPSAGPEKEDNFSSCGITLDDGGEAGTFIRSGNPLKNGIWAEIKINENDEFPSSSFKNVSDEYKKKKMAALPNIKDMKKRLNFIQDCFLKGRPCTFTPKHVTDLAAEIQLEELARPQKEKEIEKETHVFLASLAAYRY